MRTVPLPHPPVNVSYLHPHSSEPKDDEPRGLWNRMLHPAQSFESFIPGPAHEFGYSAARSFAEGQSEAITLLYIHGGFGFGKTHLLNAAALEIR